MKARILTLNVENIEGDPRRRGRRRVPLRLERRRESAAGEVKQARKAFGTPAYCAASRAGSNASMASFAIRKGWRTAATGCRVSRCIWWASARLTCGGTATPSRRSTACAWTGTSTGLSELLRRKVQSDERPRTRARPRSR